MLPELEEALLEKSGLILCEEIDGDTFKKILLTADRVKQIVVNCEGGSFYDAMGIADCILLAGGISIHGSGAVMSAALLLFVAGWNRTASKHTLFMYHGSSFPDSGPNYADKRREMQQAEAEEWLAARFMAERTNKDADFWKQKADEGNFYFTAEQALEFGVISEIV